MPPDMIDDETGTEGEEALAPMSWDATPETSAGLLSRLLFLWVQPLFSRAAYLHRKGKVLEHEDLVPLPDIDEGGRINEIFERRWKETAEGETSSPGGDDNDGGTTDNGKRSASNLKRSLLSVMGSRLLLAGCIRLVSTLLLFTFPLLLNAILRFIENTQRGEKTDPNNGYYLSALLMLAMAGKALTENWYYHTAHRAAYQSRIAVSTAVYAKALRLSVAERQGTSLGELVNLMQVDATKIDAFVLQIHVLWDGVVQIGGYMAILYTLIGWPCFVGLAIMTVGVPVMGVVMQRLFGLNHKMVQYTDARIKTTNEALQGVRCVKMYTWESSFITKISEDRGKELGLLKVVAYLRGFSRAYMGALPGIVAVMSFVAFAYATDREVEASTLFAAWVAFNQMNFPLLFYPMALAQMAQAGVSVGRVAAFLSMREASGEDSHYEKGNGNKKGEIDIKNCTIYWSDPTAPITSSDEGKVLNGGPTTIITNSSPAENEDNLTYPNAILTNINIHMAPGKLCAIVGRVGSGKSTLCSAILNETVLAKNSDGIKPHISISGSVAYAAQSAWILNATVRDNIIFGSPMDQQRYDTVIKSCQLTHDLSLLDDGDLTEIGERGINLSGGQKQRISVARAAYADADVVILDDPLSALDPEVGGRLFEECVLGSLMRGKTRVMVTNQLQCLKHCDTIVVLGEDGRIMEQGTYLELMEGGEVKRLLEDLKSDVNECSDNDNDNDDGRSSEAARTDEATKKKTEHTVTKEVVKSNEREPAKSLTTQEERVIGAVSFSVYKKYLKAGGGYIRFGFVYLTFILCTLIGLANSVIITLWTSDVTYQRLSLGVYLSIYSSLAIALGLVTFLRSFLLAKFGIRASERLHNDLLQSILRAPMSFFDTTPTGRIISRFSKDTHSIDEELSDYFDFFLFMSLYVVVSLGTITYVTPLFAIVILPIGFIYYRILNYFREVSRETKRLESVSRSPVYAHFSETLGGLATIRAYDRLQRFVQVFFNVLDQNIRSFYCHKAADRWLSVRLELIGALVSGLAAFFCCRVVVSGTGNLHFASLAGLSLTNAIAITGMLNWGVRSFAQLEAAMNSCERVLHYTENIEREAATTAAALEERARTSPVGPAASSPEPSILAVRASGGKAILTPPEWPAEGAITLRNLTMRYRTETPVVLNGLNLSIAGGERIGVVGRTGSGKSSLLLSLMRIVEPEVASATKTMEEKYLPPITIDGVDILRIGLDDLRSKLGIIPQNPVLFSGSIRTNLDPFDRYTDEQIWHALDKCNMKTTVEAMPDRLAATVAEYGDNLSQGQRQLLCLGRALLKRCRVLLLDEATSSVDLETDRAVQRTLREAFVGCTVLTIAHRVNTIMDSDKVLVMKDGVATEFAAPKVLLRDETSLFSEIVRHAEDEQS